MVCFQTKNPILGKFWRGLAMEDVGIFYGHLVIFTDIWYTYVFCGHLVQEHGYLVYFTRFGILYKEKCGSPDA
jgi:hypothetical protein